MRLWSISPNYLDAKGLVALWREALLAKHVLNGLTTGYTQHPQLNRFKLHTAPPRAIDTYLKHVYDEASNRGYKFDSSKISDNFTDEQIPVTTGQLQYELAHLRNKLNTRDPLKFAQIASIQTPETFPLFVTVPGEIADWEIVV